MFKKAIKYQSNALKKPIISYYGIMALLFMVLFFTVFTYAEEGSVGGVESTTAIFFFILALNSFTDNFKMALQNSISRKTLFYSYLINVIGFSIIMSFISSVTSAVFKSFASYDPLFLQMYGGRYLGGSFILRYIDGFLWTAVLYMLAAMLGYFITILYYRMNKVLKILVSVGLPALFFVVMPFIEYNWTNGAIAEGILDVMSFMIGGPTTSNPYYFIASSIGTVIILSGLSYALMKKAVIKTA